MLLSYMYFIDKQSICLEIRNEVPKSEKKLPLNGHLSQFTQTRILKAGVATHNLSDFIFFSLRCYLDLVASYK